MDERCKGRKCLREINPEQFPGVYWGTPGEYDPDCGCCNDCQLQLSFISESAPIEKSVWDNIEPKPTLIQRKR